MDNNNSLSESQRIQAEGIEIAVGDHFIDDSGNIFSVTAVDSDLARVTIQEQGTTWQRTATLQDFLPTEDFRRKYQRLSGGAAVAMKDAAESLLLTTAVEDTAELSAALTTKVISPAQMKVMRHQFQTTADRAEVTRRILERKRRELSAISNKMRGRLGYMTAVLSAMEGYLGIYEEVTQIADGQAATKDTPIHIMQTILFMDEEVGDVELRESGQIGIDFSSVDEFDSWLMTGNNWRNITPYPKCIVALKPSGQQRNYGDLWANLFAQDQNNMVYLLIRNGERFFRIYTDLVGYEKTLFPTLPEWEKVMEKLYEAESEEGELRARHEELYWRKQVAMLQGIFDRLDVLAPKPSDLDLFAETDYEDGRIVLVRDYESTKLTDGRLPFAEWRKALNAQIKRGNRILLARLESSADSNGTGRSIWLTRFGGQYWNWHPPLPDPGVYTVQEVRVRNGSRQFKILYNPEDLLNYGWSNVERSKRVGFWVSEYDQVLAYDHISLDDVSFYVGRRLERRQYQRILPSLYRVYRERTNETAHEAEFVEYFAAIEGVEEAAVWDAVDWWKHRNIWKRPLAGDNAKAWRMIRRHLKKKEQAG